MGVGEGAELVEVAGGDAGGDGRVMNDADVNIIVDCVGVDVAYSIGREETIEDVGETFVEGLGRGLEGNVFWRDVEVYTGIGVFGAVVVAFEPDCGGVGVGNGVNCSVLVTGERRGDDGAICEGFGRDLGEGAGYRGVQALQECLARGGEEVLMCKSC